MRTFSTLYAEAILRAGSNEVLESSLPKVRDENELRAMPDSFYLSEMSRRVFHSGLRHAMVDTKWPAFEKAFFGFDPLRVSRMSDEELEQLMGDTSIIRHLRKIKSVRHNAAMIVEFSDERNGFGNFIADWPARKIFELWAVLKKQGSQLGGQSGARFLRMVGKDTYLLREDVVAVLVSEGIVDKAPSSKKVLQIAQDAFNRWQGESGRSLSEISRIISYVAEQ